MRHLYYITFILFLLLSCSKEDTPPNLSVDKQSINILGTSGIDSFSISSNSTWTLSGMPTWLSANATNGNGNAKVYISFSNNQSLSSRSAKLKLSIKGADTTYINVTQQGAGPSIIIDKTALQISDAGQKDSIVINANVPWVLSIPTEQTNWIQADRVSGAEGRTVVNFTFKPNLSVLPRASSLTFSSTGPAINPVLLNVNQEQPAVKIQSYTNFAPGGAEISIYGSGFSPAAIENVVKINDVIATVTSSAANRINVIVPAKVGSGPLTVTVNTKSDTSEYNFEYKWTGAVTEDAGSTQGYRDGNASTALFSGPTGMDVDANGNLYVADYLNYKVRKITPAGIVSTLPGRLDGPDGMLDYGLPNDVVKDANGNIYVVELNSNAISKIDPSGQVTLFAGGVNAGFRDDVGTKAEFSWPTGIDVDAEGNLIVSEYRNHSLRKITPQGVVTRVAGGWQGYKDGDMWEAKFNTPQDVALDVNGNYLVADFYNSRVRKVTPAGIVTTFAGHGGHTLTDGPLMTASMYHVRVITSDKKGNIYTADESSNNLRWITPEGIVRTVYSDIELKHISGIAVDLNGVIYLAEYYNNRIVKILIK